MDSISKSLLVVILFTISMFGSEHLDIKSLEKAKAIYNVKSVLFIE